MRKLIREPLLHFLLIGALLFLVYGTINPAPEENEISIDDNLVNELVAKWELQRNRQPNLEELLGLVEQYIEQEVLYQEALLMNLDHNDEIVKRRLAQKMEFISDNMTEALQPTKEMLISYYEKNKSNYTKPPVYSFNQVYFSNDSRINAETDALHALNSGSPETFGDQLILPGNYINTSATQIARDYGSEFISALDSLDLNKWDGPIRSSYGYHLVFISEKKAPGSFTFEEVKEKVGVDYNFDASNDFKKELISSILNNYNINLEIENEDLKAALNEKY